ncbi:DUF2968 domain-containing protein [Paraburkholderia humisilvae]|uniref:DUF2968 domain-containing protein n=1 Tax=Paraburkholderia humisilvae TaxID=627669 RepID=A0A6J5F651_9BURK|nr:DUF2968 domain-containing protein [Paraburkholderia humisilvae]CAB3773843.1 hypothetical protein LMG29542_07465 [Paraburkholderia humisilvae]
MRYLISLYCLILLAACSLLTSNPARLQGNATRVAPTPKATPATKDFTPQVTESKPEAHKARSGAQGDVANLTRLLNEVKLVELRTTYNGSYGAALFFWPTEATYYVALFQGRHFWRVLKMQDDMRAEHIYMSFADDTRKLAEVEIRRTRLMAQEQFLQREITLSENRVKRLEADLNIAREQQANVGARQRAIEAEALILKGQKDDALSRLRQVEQRVMQLQSETEEGFEVPNRK